MKIPIRKIKTGNDRRQTSEVKVRELAESIKQNGLINPITIGRDNFLIAGLHRLEACRLLGWKEIECKKEDCIHNEDKFKLLEIDENLIRSELDYITRGDLQVEKDEILERLGLRADQSNKGTGELNSPVKTTAELAKEIGISERTLQFEKQISRNLSAEVKKIAREIELPKKDAIRLSKETKEEQKKIIDEIKVDKTKSVATIAHRTDIKRIKADIASGKTKLPEGKYEIIVVDPPWRYSEKEDAGYDSESFRGTTPYPTMSIDEIKKLKLPTSNDCVVWLWTTQKHLKYAFGILESWGFEDKAILTWCKNKMGIGKWLRSKSEFCIMAVKGKPKINLTNQTTVLNANVREHSRKPDEFYSMVDELCIGRKLDYFSRESRKGWDSHGVEISKF